ncbi:FAD-dependent monooxygenase [Paenarthrobacter ureafaciens]|uniref:FAD-dependent monooxygenase n=1 Tax=Paenarthrobacter ureafaciens TaxID=37931 RepID=UPI00140C7A79|nr:FAD-dependent monooxygenase [Paenarthrobacter ureafaciens]MCX8456106.1 FAD-dependent monooxygenase [Paenarthrobacter ureafaciens]MCY0973655.1 FAD-dependent monooxygenase [Paenarthrobacter ureafaciens]
MTAVQKVAIAGSGVAAMATAIQLAKAGIAVEVFEAKPELSALGSGITLQGNALRVFDALGVWEDVRDKGLAFEGLTLRAPGPDAPVIAQLPEVKTGGPDYPACMGMYRPDLAKILMQHAEKAGATVNFRAKVTGFREVDPARVEVFVNDESAGTFDLLIGADGVNSTVRSLMGIETAPETTGMGIWRAFVSRPKDVEHSELYYGGPAYIAGYTPTGEDTMYAFLVEKAQDRFGVSDEQAVEIMRGESMAYGGPWNSIREDLNQAAKVNYTWFTKHLVPGRWNRGRVVIIGDAAHSCPPTIAQGAAQALEDALVLAELLTGSDEVNDKLWDAFHERRIPRVQAVVDASVQLGQWQIEGKKDADAPGLLFGIAQKMAVPA